METTQKTLKTLSHNPGIYIYRDIQKTILYIGKAKDLKKRVPHFQTDFFASQVDSIDIIQTASEFDALILEAKLIRLQKPKYNVVLKDDKSPLYILLTFSEKLPQVLLIRNPKKVKRADAVFGPFQSASIVRSLLRQLRHTIPYCTQKRRTGRPCFYSHIGLCAPCPSNTMCDTHVYRKNIFRLKQILSGKSNTVLKALESDMKKRAEQNQFEEASMLRTHIQNLYRLLAKKYDPSVYLESHVTNIYEQELADLGKALHLTNLHRIECYDISNIGGAYATGSMVVFTDGQIHTSEYKRFRIKRENTPNDVAMMTEVLKRRIVHSEWDRPNLIIIDGGKGQLAAAKNIPFDIPVVGLAKRFEEIIIPVGDTFKTLRLDLSSPAMHLVQRIRDEAHRFALSYHRLLRRRAFGTIDAT